MNKLKFIALTALLFTSTQALSSNIFTSKDTERPETKIINPLFFNSKIKALENRMTAIISVKYSDFIKGELIFNEISEKNWAKITEDGEDKFVMRIMIMGIHKNSDTEAVKELLVNNTFSTNCLSLAYTNSGRIPLCHFDVNNKDLIIAASKSEKYQGKIKLSTKWINSGLKLHTEYEKDIGRMIIKNFHR